MDYFLRFNEHLDVMHTSTIFMALHKHKASSQCLYIYAPIGLIPIFLFYSSVLLLIFFAISHIHIFLLHDIKR